MKLADPRDLPRGPRRFVAYWIRDIAVGFDKSWWSVVPLRFIICAGVGIAVGRTASSDFLSNGGDRIAFFAAILAVNAILLAVCWAVFSKVYETLAEPDFGAYVASKGMDGYYEFYVDYVQFVQTIAVAVVLAALVQSIIPSPEWLARIAVGATLATSVYAGVWASGCVRLMQDLTGAKNTYSAHTRSQSNVRPLAR